jgi:hypothetical protein
MDEDHKGCLIVGGCFVFLGICGMVILITSLAVLLKVPSVPSQPAVGGPDTQFDPTIVAFNSLLTLICELVKYVITPFVPILNLISSKQP